jgi:hypothetical protein
MNYERDAAIGVIGLAGFQLLGAWNANAPSLSDLRSSHPGDTTTRQKLMDADFMVGGLAVILGTAFAVITKDMTALVLMISIFGSISLWCHSVLNADSR